MKNLIIITGASSGLGLEFARQLVKSILEGKSKWSDEKTSELWLIARSVSKLTESKKELDLIIGDSKKISVQAHAFDASGIGGTRTFENLLTAEKAAGDFTIKLLVNNAGFGTYGPFKDTPAEKELEMTDLNVTGLTGFCASALPYLERGSTIINTASLAAFLPLGNFAVYAATKAYVLSFSAALAAELKDFGIDVCALCPGSVSTNFANVASNGARKEVLHGKDPVKVVAHCLEKAAKGKRIILWSAQWKFTAFMSRFIGRYFGARMTYKYAKRPYKSE